MKSANKKVTGQTKKVEKAFIDSGFNHVEAYRYNSASIRVRVIDSRFSGKSRINREKMVWPVIESLSDELQAELTVLLLLAPGEKSRSMMNMEFEDPTPSRL